VVLSPALTRWASFLAVSGSAPNADGLCKQVEKDGSVYTEYIRKSWFELTRLIFNHVPVVTKNHARANWLNRGSIQLRGARYWLRQK
jgi:hypothetical protein